MFCPLLQAWCVKRPLNCFITNTVQLQAWCVHCPIGVPIGLVIQKLTVQANYSNKKKSTAFPPKKEVDSLWSNNCCCCFFFNASQSESDKKLVDKVDKLVAILGGETTIALHLEFLIRNNHADLLILKNTKVLPLFIHKFFTGWCSSTCAFGRWRKTTISPLNFSLCTVYVLVIWCWHNSPIRVIKGTLYICTLHLSVSIFYVIFSYLFVCI